MTEPPPAEPADLGLPPLDFTRSPSTGWTRAHWEALADRMLLAVRPYASPRHALLDLPGPMSRNGRYGDRMEGFARTFLLAGFRLSASGGFDPHNFAEWFAEALTAGSDPSSDERWPTPTELGSANVESASIALALHETRPYIWDRLDDRVRQRLVDWMAQIVGPREWTNNWVWFQSITEAFLKSVGGPWSAEDIERNCAATDIWYSGDGWYSDGVDFGGRHRNFDYYGGWAMHFFPLWFTRVAGGEAGPGRHAVYAERLRRYLADAQHLIGADGSPVYQGRSLTYRFAVAAPFWTGALFDATDLPPGRTRRLASGMLRFFIESGCLDSEGLQTVGWQCAFDPGRQAYSGPGSPYWSGMGFAGLVLPPEHPVWTAPEEPLDVERRDVEVTIAPAGSTVSATRADGIVRIVNHRSDHITDGRPALDDPVYARLAYSTHAAPEIDAAAGWPLDSSVVLLDEWGRASHRRPFEPLRIAGRVAVSRHRAHWRRRNMLDPGPLLTTATVLRGPFEVRIVRVDTDHADESPGPWRLRFGGWPLATSTDGSIEDAPQEGGTIGLTTRLDRPGRPWVTSAVRPLWDGPAETGRQRLTRTNPMGAQSATPWVATADPVTPGRLYAAVVVLSGSDDDLREQREVRVSFTGGGAEAADGVDMSDVAEVTWPDGSRDRAVLDPTTSAARAT